MASMPSLGQESPDQLHRYYNSLESILAYKLILSNAHHHGYYDIDTFWPFPINGALRKMEDQLLSSLKLEAGAKVLDAGCGFGHVAIRAADRFGLWVQCIDIMDYHISKVQATITTRKLQTVKVRKMDYHNLKDFSDESFDGVYQMESLAHATEPQDALREFFRVLRPGGSIAIHDFEWDNADAMPFEVGLTRQMINKYTSMSAEFRKNSIQGLLKQIGFQDIEVKDFSTNVWPMSRLLYILSYIPYLAVRLFKLESSFANVMVGTEAYRTRKYWRYVSISAKKPRIGASRSKGITL